MMTIPFLLTAGVVTYLSSYGRNIVEEMETQNRIFNYIEHQSTSGSYYEREAAAEHALRVIKQSPLLGDFASYPAGLYSHNILSAWVDYGLTGFILHIGVFITAIFVLYYQRARIDLPFMRIMLSLIIIAEVFLKSHSYFLTSMFLGYLTGSAAANPLIPAVKNL
jgi:hypothetical protein